jgi:2-keto-4-pentenoate hydratase
MSYTATREDIAQRLRDAYRGIPVPPLRDGLSPQDSASAYAIQEINARYWQNQGRRIVGHKVGLTARAVQVQLGVDQPDFGVLFEDMQIPDAGFLLPSAVLQPKAEAEVALVLKRELRHAATSMEDVLAATDYAVSAIEIVDSRIADWKITFADTVADNGSSAFFVLGSTKKPPAGLDLYSCGMVLEVNGAVVSLGAGAACLGHPLQAAAWLARTLVANGDHLREGDVIMTGALGPMVALQPADTVTARIGGLGSVSFTYKENAR